MTERFDKFTERARKVLTLAQEEAQRFNHNYIGTEHILLGLVREGDGIAARVLANLGVELPKVRSAVEFIIGRPDRMVVGEIGLTPRGKKVIELAVDEARSLDHTYIGTEHLLLGLVREGEGIAGVLESLGVSLEKVRTQVVQVLNANVGDRATFQQVLNADVEDSAADRVAARHRETGYTVGEAERLKRLNDRAKQALTQAQEEARRCGHSAMEPEHILLSLLRDETSIATRVLVNLGFDPAKLISVVDQMLAPQEMLLGGAIGLSAGAKQVITRADTAARQMRSTHIGTGHLLLGLVGEDDIFPFALLISMGGPAPETLHAAVARLAASSDENEV